MSFILPLFPWLNTVILASLDLVSFALLLFALIAIFISRLQPIETQDTGSRGKIDQVPPSTDAHEFLPGK